MTRSARFPALMLLPLALAACQTTGAPPAGPSPASDSHALAQAACSQCHSVEAHGLSPNPQAPEFPVIANTRGLTRASLTNWLRNAHNYPEEMDFYLEDDEVAGLVSYILKLERDAYQPPI